MQGTLIVSDRQKPSERNELDGGPEEGLRIRQWSTVEVHHFQLHYLLTDGALPLRSLQESEVDCGYHQSNYSQTTPHCPWGLDVWNRERLNHPREEGDKAPVDDERKKAFTFYVTSS